MSNATVNTLKVEVLSWLRYGYEDDPECGSMSAREIAETFGRPVDEVMLALQQLERDNKVLIAREWGMDDRDHEWSPIPKGYRW